jgi:hypothetical protein
LNGKFLETQGTETFFFFFLGEQEITKALQSAYMSASSGITIKLT